MLSEQQLQHYRDHGYVVVRQLIQPSDIEPVMARADAMIAGQAPSDGFVAGAASNEGPDDPGRLVKQVMATEMPIKDPVLAGFSQLPAIKQVVAQLLEADGDPAIFQQQVLIKEPGAANATPWHQDNYYWNITDPQVRAVTAWSPALPTRADSGTMWLLPDSQNEPIHPHEPAGGNSKFRQVATSFDESKLIPLELDVGDVSFHHPHVIHGAYANSGRQRRVAIAQHYLYPPGRDHAG